ncbi:MAG: hypothetical protein AB7L94_08805, partial [Kofleriaceae bacterium]
MPANRPAKKPKKPGTKPGTKSGTKPGPKPAKPASAADALPRIGAPALRALASIGVTRASQLAKHTEAELLALHGVGPRAIRILAEHG